VSGVGVAAVRLARHDDVHRRTLFLHDPHLHRRRVRAQQYAVRHEEGVVQRPGGVIGGRVEGLEVVVLGLDFRPLGYLVTHADEDVLDLPLRLGDEVQAPQRRRPARKRDIYPLALQRREELLSLHYDPALFKRSLEGLADEVAHLAHFGPLLDR